MNANLKFILKEINDDGIDNTLWEIETYAEDICYYFGGNDGRLYDKKMNDLSNCSIHAINGCLAVWITVDTEEIVARNNPDYFVFSECGGVAVYLF